MKPNVYAMLVALLVAVFLVGCGGGTPPETAPEEAATSEEEAAPVEEAAEADVAVDESVSGEISVVGSTTVQPLVEELRDAFLQRYPNVEMNVAAGGSVVGIQAVQNGETDIGMASRNLREGEQTEGMEVHRIAVDVLAVIVHPSNSITGLSSDELKGIFTGEITNWSEVGGEDMAILPVIREVTSGTRGAFDDIALDGDEPTDDADVQITAGEVEARVASTENAIGYVGFGHIELDEINVLEIDGVAPSPESAMDDSYSLQRPLQLLTGPLSRELATIFVDFALSPEGQELVEADGWVPVAAAASQ